MVLQVVHSKRPADPGYRKVPMYTKERRPRKREFSQPLVQNLVTWLLYTYQDLDSTYLPPTHLTCNMFYLKRNKALQLQTMRCYRIARLSLVSQNRHGPMSPCSEKLHTSEATSPNQRITVFGCLVITSSIFQSFLEAVWFDYSAYMPNTI